MKSLFTTKYLRIIAHDTKIVQSLEMSRKTILGEYQNNFNTMFVITNYLKGGMSMDELVTSHIVDSSRLLLLDDAKF